MAVNTYRFIGMYIMIGFLIGLMTVFAQDTSTTTKGYDLDRSARITEIEQQQQQVWNDSKTLVKSNDLSLSSSYGDEKELGISWGEVLLRGFLPTGFISDRDMGDATEIEKGANRIVKWLRAILAMFASYELFQIIIKSKTT